MKVLVADPVGEEGIDILCARAGVGVDNIDVEEETLPLRCNPTEIVQFLILFNQ